MKALEIRALVRRLFNDGPVHPLHQAAGRQLALADAERQAVADPAFGWHLATWYAEAGQVLPGFVTQPALTRANRFLLEPSRPDPDLPMALAHGLNLPGSERQRDLLQALLLCEGATASSTAALLHLEEEVIALFETLFWSTLGRERAYLARLCRPAKAAPC